MVCFDGKSPLIVSKQGMKCNAGTPEQRQAWRLLAFKKHRFWEEGQQSKQTCYKNKLLNKKNLSQTVYNWRDQSHGKNCQNING